MKALVKGIVARLKSAVSTRSYLDAPQNAIFPYITVDISGDERYTKTTTDTQYQIVINTWSRDKSPEDTLTLLASVKSALDRQESSITLDSGTLVMLQYVSEDCFKDPDGVTWHGIQIYNAYFDFGA